MRKDTAVTIYYRVLVPWNKLRLLYLHPLTIFSITGIGIYDPTYDIEAFISKIEKTVSEISGLEPSRSLLTLLTVAR